MRPAFIIVLLVGGLTGGTIAVLTSGWFYLGFVYGLLWAFIAHMVLRP